MITTLLMKRREQKMQKRKANRKTAPPGFLTAQEAMQTVGAKSTSFYDLVKNNIIPAVLLPGRSEAVYPIEKVEEYRRSMVKAMSAYKDPNAYDFSLAIKEDIPEIRKLVAEESGGWDHTVPQHVMEAWLRKNPEALHILWRGNEIVGYVSMFPLPTETAIKRLIGEYWNRTIPIDDIQPFLPKNTYPLYIAEMVARQDKYEDEARRSIGTKKHGMRLIIEVAKLLVQWSIQDINFEDIYAVGTSDDGIHICKTLGMLPLDMEGNRPGRIPFKLEMVPNQSLLKLANFRTAVA
jgi:hypothetical protein